MDGRSEPCRLNAQPWLFRVLPDRIDVFADPTRTIGTIDPLLREQQISLGCALENLVVAATAHGLRATPTLLPVPSDRSLAASVRRGLADLLPDGGQAIMTFRAGCPTQTAPPSPRRAIDDVLLDGPG